MTIPTLPRSAYPPGPWWDEAISDLNRRLDTDGYLYPLPKRPRRKREPVSWACAECGRPIRPGSTLNHWSLCPTLRAP